MKFQHAALLLLGCIAPVLGKSMESASPDAQNLYWYDLYRDGWFGYMCGSSHFTYNNDDCPLVGNPSWFAAISVDICKKRCNEMNKNWNHAEDPIPPCTSIAFDEPASECALRRCVKFPVILAEHSSTHSVMGETYDRYKNNIGSKPIQDFFVNFFDTSGDAKCYPGETLRRVTEWNPNPQRPYDYVPTPGSYVCELDGTSEGKTDLPNPDAENPEYRDKIPHGYFWDNGLPTFDGCWEGMEDATVNDEYLTYLLSVRLDYEWQQHYFKYEKEFKRHGYDNGVESTIQIVFDQVSWLFREQFRINLKYSQYTLQNNDGSWPRNPWMEGDAGTVDFSGAYKGGGGIDQLCTSKGMLVGGPLFVENKENPKYPLYSFGVAGTLAHELAHQMGHEHNPVYMPDICVGDGLPSYRRCDDPNNPGQKKVCSYKSFLKFNNVDPVYNYVTKMCNHIRSKQGQCCAVVEPLGTLHSHFPVPSEKTCALGTSLCPDGEPCKYKGGGINWDWKGMCKDGYENIMRERDEVRPSIFSQASRYACMEALADMQSIGIDIRFKPDACPINLYDKPAGCYITCIDGEMVGYFNENAWNSIGNKWNDAEPLCVRVSTASPTASLTASPTASPTIFKCINNDDCSDNDECTRDKCKKKKGVCMNRKIKNKCCNKMKDCVNVYNNGKCKIYKCNKKKELCRVKMTVDCTHKNKCAKGKCK